jgi:UDP-GlcNAc:undecaprenyl-phosphate/decaprenyl-phosphate GlcNAc-1-phosphate transferase
MIYNLFKRIGLSAINYQGELIPTGSGLIFILGAILFWALLLILDIDNELTVEKYIFIISIIGGVGLIDDLIGNKEFQGYKGHLKQLFKGKLTTGGLKAIVALLISILVVNNGRSIIETIINIFIFLLMTNFLNLLDLRPGRSIKIFILLSLFLFLLQKKLWIIFLPIYIIIIFYLPYELRGEIMLGDTGSNILGAISGLAYSMFPHYYIKIPIFIILLIINILAERISLSKIIKNNRILNYLDNLGKQYN